MKCEYAQMDRFLNILDRIVIVAERWVEVEYPKRDETPAEIYRQGSQEEPTSVKEYQELPEPEGRFEKKHREAHPQT